MSSKPATGTATKPTTATTTPATATTTTTPVSETVTTAVTAVATTADALWAAVSATFSDAWESLTYFKKGKYEWKSDNAAGTTTPGWELSGSIGTIMKRKGDPYEFVVSTNILAPTGFAAAPSQIYSSYLTFKGTSWSDTELD